jgi:hypothetical protein
MAPAICTRTGQRVQRVESLPLRDTLCPFCGAALRLPTAAEWPRPILRVLKPDRPLRR